MTDLRKAAEMALEALRNAYSFIPFKIMEQNRQAVEALRLALAHPEQEFVGACVTCGAPKGEWLVDAVNITAERVDETAKHEHEPVAWVLYYINEGGVSIRETFYTKDRMEFHKSHNEANRGLKCEVTPLYTAPPVSDYHEGWEEGFKAGKREWVGLTDEEIYDYADKFLYQHGSNYGIRSFGKAIEAKLKEKNT